MSTDNEQELVTAIMAYREEADAARKSRLAQNQVNWEQYTGNIDWGDKIPGQSMEFLPKVGTAVDHMAANLTTPLVSGDWLDVKYPEPEVTRVGLTAKDCEKLLLFELDHLAAEDPGDFSTFIGDAIKMAALESPTHIKVTGCNIPLPKGPGGRGKRYGWRLDLQLVNPNFIFLDPTGQNLYLLHEYTLDRHEAIRLAKAGYMDFDLAAIESLSGYIPDPQMDPVGLRETRGATRGSHRRQVCITECWGTIVSPAGEILAENGVVVLGDHKTVISNMRNPNWHERWPFVQVSLVRAPGSVLGKAPMDDAVQLAQALNELFNLMIDGAISSVWGIKQLRQDYLVDPGQGSDGIPQGETLLVNTNLPPGEKVLETVATGDVPADAMAMFEKLNSEFSQASSTSELALGKFPQGEVKATEAIQVQQAQSSFYGSIVRSLERVVERVAQMSLQTIMQYVDSIDFQELRDVLGHDLADNLRKNYNDQTRAVFDAFSSSVNLTVSGLRQLADGAVLSQRIPQFLQSFGIVGQASPIMMQMGYDPRKAMQDYAKAIDIDLQNWEMSPQEAAAAQQAPGAPQQPAGSSPGMPGSQGPGVALPAPQALPTPGRGIDLRPPAQEQTHRAIGQQMRIMR